MRKKNQARRKNKTGMLHPIASRFLSEDCYLLRFLSTMITASPIGINPIGSHTIESVRVVRVRSVMAVGSAPAPTPNGE
jgi:hypothetical protein